MKSSAKRASKYCTYISQYPLIMSKRTTNKKTDWTFIAGSI